MRTNQRKLQLGSLAACALALMGLTVGAAMASTPPSLAYHFSSHPMISGTVVSVNDHQMVVDTDQGEQVPLEVDTRTMAPRDLAPGMVMRVEFLALEDCRFYAQRIMPIRGGMSTSRLQAYANTHDSQESMARNGSTYGGYRTSGEGQVSAESQSVPQTMGEHSQVMTATPATADYVFSTRPMFSGRVVSVNDHRLVVETDQGQQVGLVMDSRTMVPAEVAPGTMFRAEFKQLGDGRYYAKRISQIESSVAEREQAYAHTRDSDFAIAQNSSDCGFVSTATSNSQTSSLQRREAVASHEPVVAQSVSAERPETLPQTASHQPLLLLLGFIALGSAGLITVVRGFRSV